MCDFEEFLFTCDHSIVKMKSECHFRRNDPGKQCFSVKVLKVTWPQGRECDACRTPRASTSRVSTPRPSNPRR
ncbi:hypothetical protein CMUS01_12112 [Colletotrichum musicola]|uniref:Uncharacterized protein n=1 Tax=Colletotrichum musicola TaxID=2175873 RepID=A0A8H6JQ97_9PEZI|nr:hypothetical protein CMUS01_12112 [Colletotrichum musicola]